MLLAYSTRIRSGTLMFKGPIRLHMRGEMKQPLQAVREQNRSQDVMISKAG
jgi:hypothetical protein